MYTCSSPIWGNLMDSKWPVGNLQLGWGVGYTQWVILCIWFDLFMRYIRVAFFYEILSNQTSTQRTGHKYHNTLFKKSLRSSYHRYTPWNERQQIQLYIRTYLLLLFNKFVHAIIYTGVFDIFTPSTDYQVLWVSLSTKLQCIAFFYCLYL